MAKHMHKILPSDNTKTVLGDISACTQALEPCGGQKQYFFLRTAVIDLHHLYPPCSRPVHPLRHVPLCDIPSGCCFFTGLWTVTRSSLCVLRRVAVFCQLLRPVLLLVLFPRSRSPGAPPFPPPLSGSPCMLIAV